MSTCRELLVISGKGGTGKTSLTAAFAMLAENAVLADADVDAADLHLLLTPVVRREEVFRAGHEAIVRSEICTGCGACVEHCRFDALQHSAAGGAVVVDPVACEGCGVCVRICPADAIAFPEVECGRWYESDTRAGLMVHARLNPGGENSGRLVTLVRREAARVAEQRGANLILIDGPPGVGCPVIAALGGVSLALAVTEPTPSGEHDLLRVLDLARHFSIPVAVCVNKWDLHPQNAERIEAMARQRGALLAGRVRYSTVFTQAQRLAKSVAELESTDLAEDVRAVWKTTKGFLG